MTTKRDNAYAIAAAGTVTSAFARKEYRVTDYGCQALLVLTFPCHGVDPAIAGGCMGTKTLILDDEEAILRTNCRPFCSLENRIPYHQMGRIDIHRGCCGRCTGFGSDLSQNRPLYVPWHCNDRIVIEIVQDLQQRRRIACGVRDIGRNKNSTTTEDETFVLQQEIRVLRSGLREMKSDLKLLLRALNVSTTESESMER